MFPLNTNALLRALSQIETGDNDKAIGRAGERSRYQIIRDTWNIYCGSRDFFTHSKDTEVATQIARAHLSRLSVKYHTTCNKPPTPQDIYVMWNAGYGYYLLKHFRFDTVPVTIRKRAYRFQNLYEKFLKDEQQLNLKLTHK